MRHPVRNCLRIFSPKLCHIHQSFFGFSKGSIQKNFQMILYRYTGDSPACSPFEHQYFVCFCLLYTRLSVCYFSMHCMACLWLGFLHIVKCSYKKKTSFGTVITNKRPMKGFGRALILRYTIAPVLFLQRNHLFLPMAHLLLRVWAFCIICVPIESNLVILKNTVTF